MLFLGQNRHQLKEEDKGLSLLCLSIRVCPSTPCIKMPSGFFSEPATLVGPLHLRAFVPPSISPSHRRSRPPPPLSPLLSVCNGPDEEGGEGGGEKTKEVREMEERSEKKRASGRNWRVKEGRDKRRREGSEEESGGGGGRGDTGARCTGGERRPSL